jgi:hypothetical protein
MPTLRFEDYTLPPRNGSEAQRTGEPPIKHGTHDLGTTLRAWAMTWRADGPTRLPSIW